MARVTRKEANAVDHFTADLEKLAVITDQEPTVVLRKVTFDLHSAVTSRTPVDTGRARANWQVEEGSPSSKQAKELGPNPAKPSPPPATSSAIRTQRGKIRAIKSTGSKIYITNNLPYIPVLENGSSKQAPLGIRSLAMAEVAAGIRTITG